MKALNSFLTLSTMLLLTLPMSGQHQHPHAEKASAASETPTHQEATFKVYGNCNMCKKRIEGALKGVQGVMHAEWNVDSKMLTVHYDDKTISLEAIKKKVAQAGHDTDEFRAQDEVYNALPGCCQYDRPQSPPRN